MCDKYTCDEYIKVTNFVMTGLFLVTNIPRYEFWVTNIPDPENWT